MIRLLCGTANEDLARAFRTRLDEEADVDIVGVLPTASALLAAARDSHSDVVLVDAVLPGLDFVEVELCRRLPGRVFAWSSDHHGSLFVRQLSARAGAGAPQASEPLDRIGELVRRLAVIGDLGATAEAMKLQARADENILSRAELTMAREALLVQLEQLENRNVQLESAHESLEEKMVELTVTYRATVQALASAVEMRDGYTGGHIERVSKYSLALARAMDERLMAESLVFGYMLHDVGKLGIPDAVLLKPGKLTSLEYAMVKTHTTEGARYVAGIPFLTDTIPLVRNHHERWDGQSYPDGLAGEEIPRVARLFTVADALDAMTTDRPYRRARTLDEALAEALKASGSQFDPEVVAVFADLVSADEGFGDLRAGIVPGRSDLSA